MARTSSSRKPAVLRCASSRGTHALENLKIAGKPMLVMAHGTVGLQHASMDTAFEAYDVRLLDART